MSTLRFALSSMKYHKKSLIFYSLIVFVGTFSLVAVVTLYHALRKLLEQSEALLGVEQPDPSLASSMTPVTSTYQALSGIILLAFACSLISYLLFYQHQKKHEYVAWKKNNASTSRWLCLQLMEIIFPLILVVGLLTLLSIVFQPYLQNHLLHNRLTLFSINQVDHSIFQEISRQNSEQQFSMMFPQTDQAFIQTFELNSSSWLRIFLRSMLFSFSVLALLSVVLTLLIASFYCFYWRRTLWKKIQ